MVHLINDGITRTSSGNGSVAITKIEWLSAPSEAVVSQIRFLCSVDGGPVNFCKTVDIIIMLAMCSILHEGIIYPCEIWLFIPV